MMNIFGHQKSRQKLSDDDINDMYCDYLRTSRIERSNEDIYCIAYRHISFAIGELLEIAKETKEPVRMVATQTGSEIYNHLISPVSRFLANKGDMELLLLDSGSNAKETVFSHVVQGLGGKLIQTPHAAPPRNVPELFAVGENRYWLENNEFRLKNTPHSFVNFNSHSSFVPLIYLIYRKRFGLTD